MGETATTRADRRSAARRRRRPGPTVRDVMTPRSELAILAPEATLREVAALLAARHVAGAPVLAGSVVVGVVSAADLLDFAATAAPGEDEAEEEDDWAEWGAAAIWPDEDEWTGAGDEAAVELSRAHGGDLGVLDEHTAAEVMSRRLRSISPAASLRQAAQAMRRAGVHRLLVLDDGTLVGMITSTDLLRAVAEGVLHG